MAPRFPFRNLEPAFCSGLFDDPLLLVRQRPLGSNLLFDCGQLNHLAKRTLTAIEAIFVSHTHMDHWMGIDTLTRHFYVTPRTVRIFGPPGIAAKLAAKLAGYDWNLCEPDWGSYQIDEIHEERIESQLLSGPDGYRRSRLESRPRDDRVIFYNRLLKVEAELCDHLVDSLIFRISEQPGFSVDEAFLQRRGLVKGPWIRQLKRRYFRQEQLDAPLTVLHQGADGPEDLEITDVRAFCAGMFDEQQPASLGYISDIGVSASNLAKITGLLQGVTLLLCETTFLRDDRDKARSTWHLCTDDVNRLLEQLRPAYFLPMHLSKSYNRCSQRLYQELEPPPGTTLLRIPDMVTPRPLLQMEFPWREYAPELGEEE